MASGLGSTPRCTEYPHLGVWRAEGAVTAAEGTTHGNNLYSFLDENVFSVLLTKKTLYTPTGLGWLLAKCP